MANLLALWLTCWPWVQVPFLEAPRTFTWRKTYIDVNSKVVDRTVNDHRIDLRESVFNFLRQEVYTKDTVLVDVNALMYYSIGDVRKVHRRWWEVDGVHASGLTLLAWLPRPSTKLRICKLRSAMSPRHS